MRVEAANLLDTKTAPLIISRQDVSGTGYFDLRENPAAITKIAAAREHAALAGFLVAINGEDSLLSTVRAKVWAEEPAQGQENYLFKSRLDLIFAHDLFNYSAEKYEEILKRLVDLWMRDPGTESLTTRLEIVPCQFEKVKGAALRIILTAQGSSAEQARTRWGLGLVRVQQALLFISRAMRQKLGIDSD
jgi:hypothetical protein